MQRRLPRRKELCLRVCSGEATRAERGMQTVLKLWKSGREDFLIHAEVISNPIDATIRKSLFFMKRMPKEKSGIVFLFSKRFLV